MNLKNNYSEQTFCRVCKSNQFEEVISLGNHSLSGVFPKKIDQDLTQGPLTLLKCKGNLGCNLVQLKHNFDHNEMYGENYGYRSGLNSSMVAHLKQKVRYIEEFISLKSEDLIIDIGSNDATTLSLYKNKNLNLFGIDPTGRKFSEFYNKNIKLIPEFFSLENYNKILGNKKSKVITSFSMFYDLDDPIQFVRDIKSVLADDGIWVTEQSYLPSMLKTNSFDTICHEHLEYYSITDIKYIVDQCGLKIVDLSFNDINGGSFSITISHKNSKISEFKNLDSVILDEKYISYDLFVKNTFKLKEELLNLLKNFKRDNIKVAGIGASTKGNVLLQFYGITADLLKYIGEVNEDKFGRYTPGTNIPIIPENEVLESDFDYLLILPWHFRDFFLNNKKFKNKKLIFPLPNVEIINT